MRQNTVNKDQNVAYRRFKEGQKGNRLGLRFASGRMRSMHYSFLPDTDYNPELGGIILESVGFRLSIEGRNLQQLYFDIEDEMVAEIIERHANEVELDEADTYISRIKIDKI